MPGCRPRYRSPAHLEDNLNLLIDEMAEKEQHFFRPNNSKNSWRWIGGVAATILLLIGIGYGIDNLSKNVCPPTPQDTFSDPEEAYRMLQATLLEISANLNYGLNEGERKPDRYEKNTSRSKK